LNSKGALDCSNWKGRAIGSVNISDLDSEGEVIWLSAIMVVLE
jgi:hypothetical protein